MGRKGRQQERPRQRDSTSFHVEVGWADVLQLLFRLPLSESLRLIYFVCSSFLWDFLPNFDQPLPGRKKRPSFFRSKSQKEEEKEKEENPHDVLGVSAEASWEEVRSAYRRLALQLHPDKNVGNPAAADKFMRVKSAYERLRRELEPCQEQSEAPGEGGRENGSGDQSASDKKKGKRRATSSSVFEEDDQDEAEEFMRKEEMRQSKERERVLKAEMNKAKKARDMKGKAVREKEGAMYTNKPYSEYEGSKDSVAIAIRQGSHTLLCELLKDLKAVSNVMKQRGYTQSHCKCSSSPSSGELDDICRAPFCCGVGRDLGRGSNALHFCAWKGDDIGANIVFRMAGKQWWRLLCRKNADGERPLEVALRMHPDSRVADLIGTWTEQARDEKKKNSWETSLIFRFLKHWDGYALIACFLATIFSGDARVWLAASFILVVLLWQSLDMNVDLRLWESCLLAGLLLVCRLALRYLPGMVIAPLLSLLIQGDGWMLVGHCVHIFCSVKVRCAADLGVAGVLLVGSLVLVRQLGGGSGSAASFVFVHTRNDLWYLSKLVVLFVSCCILSLFASYAWCEGCVGNPLREREGGRWAV
uniref:J domain-containing protein n=1 Tax=Chromera velia CCMP2878 TaxID=1169474 RepID=A0A0G4H6V0_9ALVE|eukprot:Cvel_5787.t1-p1 / transcript=Cvel_5787.t1 / gene=Cvel_5787 / organism=Chromera_velia_CCMP2878 / gene_product=Chaperone protein DnaJ, putative / transcript_product=Chaperone protein DnaJ, putative / location=Cvel_scaffold275:18675-20432(-) / protein_length=586 / sequence_SO=supercontig / SO=protein_coding / is_pseudo=false